ncbi:hypothetical protein BLX41_31710 [Pseudomonas protegens]|uniref:AAA family ATPase n=1 Tax=Pseudomonas protegens TaxID=380021 RepID=UPI000F4D1EB6|nr:ATP-binding protein [Pseudomonas protegens]ROL62652.1 hypothetical protein BLX41_31710 [Pseudomonas protegens]
MRLRYLNLNLYAPLSQLKVCFAQDAPWEALIQDQAQPCAIHFVVGLNGSGKSHLLRAIASIYIALADGRLPGFAFTLVYELGAVGNGNLRSVVFKSAGTAVSTSLWLAEGAPIAKNADSADFEALIEQLGTEQLPQFMPRIKEGAYPQAVTDLLPRVLAYTSGSWRAWQDIWRPPLEQAASALRFKSDEQYPFELERPVGWTYQDEASLGGSEPASQGQSSLPHSTDDASDQLNRPILLSDGRPDAALLAVVLQDLMLQRQPPQNDRGLAGLFEKAGWHRLVSVRLRVDLERALAAPRALQSKMHDLMLVAGEVLAQPDPANRLRVLHFDVGAPLPALGNNRYLNPQLQQATTQEQALTLMLGESGQSAFSRFNELSRWLAVGLIDGIEMSLRRNEKPEDEFASDSGVMSYADLSDGEQMVLRRWALFHLLAGQQDALLLLDEPETHFNDAWKREIVSNIERAMGEDANSVLIASHSAIVLSDVFDEEIIFIKKGADGSSSANQVGTRTFATDPGALMMNLFHTQDSIGSRAQQRIEAFLEHVEQVQVPTAQQIRQLKAVINRLGTGFYRSELRARLNHWEQTEDTRTLNALIEQVKSDDLKADLHGLIDKLQASRNARGDTDA